MPWKKKKIQKLHLGRKEFQSPAAIHHVRTKPDVAGSHTQQKPAEKWTKQKRSWPLRWNYSGTFKIRNRLCFKQFIIAPSCYFGLLQYIVTISRAQRGGGPSLKAKSYLNLSPTDLEPLHRVAFAVAVSTRGWPDIETVPLYHRSIDLHRSAKKGYICS